jgi:hypothetical protein
MLTLPVDVVTHNSSSPAGRDELSTSVKKFSQVSRTTRRCFRYGKKVPKFAVDSKRKGNDAFVVSL